MKTSGEKLYIEGGHFLRGNIKIQSAKNSVLPLLAACILSKEPLTLNNCVPLTDVEYMRMILSNLGADTKWDGDKIIIDCSAAGHYEIPPDLAKEIRSSIFMLGSILSRFKKAKVAYPGGCDIGVRPIDLHLKGLQALNVKIDEQNGFIICDGSEMRSGIIHLDCPSVGATENIMMASVNLEGVTKIINAAREPEIIDLQNFINCMGGKVSGAGTSIITVEGVSGLHGCNYTPMPDRIITGTYLIAAAIAGGDITLTDTNPEFVYSLLNKFTEAGINTDCGDNYISIKSSGRPKSNQIIETQPYPGFPTDLQAQMSALQSISDGTCMITENLFETRYKHISELNRMGAQITIRDRCAMIRGVPRLHAAKVTAFDLRGGASLVLAGLNARGTTVVENARIIDRGYYKIESDLSALGAKIYRE